MAYVQNHTHDVFISYASADNVPFPSETNGWVSDFVRALEVALQQRLGGDPSLSIYFDERELASNHELDTLLRAVDNSAVFLSLSSRSYVQRDWTIKELERFAEQDGIENRLFVIDVLPLDDAEYPKPLIERHRLAFYKLSYPGGNVAVPVGIKDEAFGLLIHDLAEQIRVQLMAMRAVEGVVTAAELVRDAVSDRSAVLLAQVTEDLEDERDDVRRYLEQFGHRVLPETAYPQDGPGFCARLETDLTRADLFVQLLGPFAGRRPPDLPDGYVRAQLTAVRKLGVEVIQWRSAVIDVASIKDAEQSALLNGPQVVSSGLEAFKATLQDRLTKPEPAAQHDVKDMSLQTVFVNADEPDLDYARQVRDEFVRHGFMAATPTLEPQPELLKEHLLDCDALVLLYGNASHVWADRSLRLFNKLRAQRERPPKIVAVLVGPPPEKLSELAVDMPNLRVIGDPKEWNNGAVRDMIKELKA